MLGKEQYIYNERASDKEEIALDNGLAGAIRRWGGGHVVGTEEKYSEGSI